MRSTFGSFSHPSPFCQVRWPSDSLRSLWVEIVPWIATRRRRLYTGSEPPNTWKSVVDTRMAEAQDRRAMAVQVFSRAIFQTVWPFPRS